MAPHTKLCGSSISPQTSSSRCSTRGIVPVRYKRFSGSSSTSSTSAYSSSASGSFSDSDSNTSDNHRSSDDITNNVVSTAPKELLRPWLIRIANEGIVSGLKWLDPDQTLLKIPWTHGSRQGFSKEKDSCLFEMWAVHSKKYVKGDNADPKRWKANFRCALNSLSDVEEDTERSMKKGVHAFKVYKFKEEAIRRTKSRVGKGTNTKASKKERLNQERTKKLQHLIANDKHRHMIGVRRISIPVAVKTDVEETPQIRPNSQLLNRKISLSAPTPAPQPLPSKRAPIPRTLALFGSLEPDSVAADDQGYISGGSATLKMEQLSPTTSIPTFVEGECEDFCLLDDGIMHDDYADDNFDTFFNEVEVSTEPNPKVTVRHCRSDRCSSPTLSSLNGSIDQEVIMEMDLDELKMEADKQFCEEEREIHYDQL